MIADKEGNDVNFKLNTVQYLLDIGLTGRDLIPKARQLGVSSYFLARYTAACLGNRNVRAVVISHDQESTVRMLRRVKYFLENIRGPAPKIHNMSANEITFPKTNSMFYIGTAGSRKFGRGDTITHLHCSEYAYWPSPVDLMRGLLQAVPRSGEIAIESTGNGLNDYYHRCMRAYAGGGRWKLHFFPWHTFPEYELDISQEEEELILDSLDSTIDEDKLFEKGVSPGRLMWRREKLEELDYDMRGFLQEYPMTIDECFQMTGESIFHRVPYENTEDWKKQDTHLWIQDGHPAPRYTYSLGCDVAAGVGKDNSVIEIICLETNEQVLEYASNKIDPEQLAHKINEIGEWFGWPYATVESNNHGILTLAILDRMYKPGRLHTEPLRAKTEEKLIMQLGARTTARSKPLLIGNLRAILAGGLTIHSPLLNSELTTFIENEHGQLGAQKGCHDDTVIAMACAVKGMNEAAAFKASDTRIYRENRAKDPFSLDALIEDRRDTGFPIAPQDDWVH